jgi:hypothetical protein
MDDDDIKLRSYQDDLTTDEDATDPLMDEQADDPTSLLRIPPAEFADELDKEDFGDSDEGGDDDRREALEDADEDGDDDSYR